MVKQLIDIPAIPEIEPKYLFSGSNKVLEKHEKMEKTVKEIWETIIKRADFVALQFVTGNRYPQTVMLHRSTRTKNGWQLSFIDFDGVPSRDEQYDSNFKTTGGFNEDLFTNLMQYSWHNNQLFVEARYL